MMDRSRFDFDRSAYERPNNAHVCGRGAEWGTPCRHGPNYDGTCGGVAECTPYNNRGRWECRRAQAAGGPCENGPGPDGTCGCTQPPCAPRRTLRQHRWRISVIAPGLVVAALAAFTHLTSEADIFAEIFRIGALDAGELTDRHAGFTGAQSCKTCHSAHGAQPMVWLASAFSENDMTKACVSCHTFGGPASAPHNAIFAVDKKVRQTECAMCHTEHKGPDADISGLSDEQCASCHEKPFTNFSIGHPDFSKQFPHFRRTSIKFSHASHLGKHFQDKRVAKDVPASCTTCHQAESADRTVEPLGFEEACATCHADQIPKRKLVVLRLPEFDESDIDREAVVELCGPNEEAEAEDEYESISSDEMSEISAYMMGLPSDDPGEYGGAFQELVMGMAEDGTTPLVEMLKGSAATVDLAQLLAGLNPEAAKRMACAWAVNLEYELPAEPAFGGWYGDLLELIYRPSGHADPVLMGWLNLAVAAGGEDEEALERAEEMRARLLSPKEGPGACIKCHAVTRDAEDGPLRIEWRYHKDEARSYQSYSHWRHLGLIDPQGVKLADPNKGCTTCHRLDANADFEAGFKDYDPATYSSNFVSIKKETCVQCHTQGRVRQDCQLCHNYHKEPAFAKHVTRNEG